jgi:hypothetical protein
MSHLNLHRGALACGLLLAAGLLALGERAWARGCDTQQDLAAVAATRAKVDQNCECENAVSKSTYISCVKTIANDDVAALLLDRKCRKVVLKCAKRSICGKPAGVWPCCRTNRLGKTICKVRLPEQCQSGPGGSHCVGFGVRSCCDACLGGGQCASPSSAFVGDSAAYGY